VKLKEFWVNYPHNVDGDKQWDQDHASVYLTEEIALSQGHRSIIHVREVVPIDWNKIFAELDKEPSKLWGHEKDLLKRLVEKQLAGEK
jgi:hypothetical protein